MIAFICNLQEQNSYHGIFQKEIIVFYEFYSLIDIPIGFEKCLIYWHTVMGYC